MEIVILHTQDVGTVARALVDLRDRVIQKARIGFKNRLDAIDRADDDYHYRGLIEDWYLRFADLEKDLNRDIAQLAEDMPIVQEMAQVRGMGKPLAMKIVAMIDIEKADTVSALWKYAGYAVTNGERDRLVKGQKAPYNSRLKTYCYQAGTCFLRANSPYRRIYDDAREYYDRNRPDWTDGHRFLAALRKMIKIWLSHLWVIWRTMEGLPVTDPYILAENTHHRYIRPEEFGWQP